MKTISQPLQVVLFCGGRGSTTLIKELLRWPNVHVTLIVNAYDDGLSTGALRDFIPNMLGPSDFRKNLTYLLELHSEEQYALKNLLEFRLPATVESSDWMHFKKFVHTGDLTSLMDPLKTIFTQLNQKLMERVRELLGVFFQYADQCQRVFDFADCAVGNLLFAGAYLQHQHNFNAAAQTMAQLVHSHMSLVNVSQGENRILVGLKEDGELLENEARVVGAQSPVSIHNIFLLEKPLDKVQWQTLQTLQEKTTWLQRQEKIPAISKEAFAAIQSADIIVYGPGTQHSSLLPSYRIAQTALKKSRAPVKAFVVNLEPDHDIQSWSASDIVDHALRYANDAENHSMITHILLDDSAMPAGKLAQQSWYRSAQILTQTYSSDHQKKVHNGAAIVADIFSCWQKTVSNTEAHHAVDIFVDMNKRSLAIDALSDEYFEMHWKQHFSTVRLRVNQAEGATPKSIDHVTLEKSHYTDVFPEIQYFIDWLHQGSSEYLVLWTGDGEYRFRDIVRAIDFLEGSTFGAIFGSRNQSRRQLKGSIRAAYGEKWFLYWASFFGAFLVSVFFSLRFGVILSDPLTGFRIFRRSQLEAIFKQSSLHRRLTPVQIAKILIRHDIEIAELPVHYRTFSGFTDPYWRIRRGLKNLLSLFM